MGCSQGKNSEEHKLLKGGHDKIIIEITEIVEILEEIKEKYIDSDMNQESNQLFNEETLIQLEQFLVDSYKSGLLSQKELSSVFSEIYVIFRRVHAVLSRLDEILSNKSHKLGKSIKPEIKQVYIDFINLFQEITPRILAVSQTSFDNFDHYIIHKSITQIEADSILL